MSVRDLNETSHMMNLFKWTLTAVTISMMAACGGGGGNAGDSPFGAAGCVTGASGPTCGVASNLSLQLSSPTINNDGTQKIIATATATTSSGQALSGIPISFSVDGNANFTAPGSATATNGQLAATVSIGADPSNRVVTVQAKSGSLTATASFQVTGSKLAATASSAIMTPGQAGTVQYRLTNSNDVALPNQTISVAGGPAGTAQGVTGVNGDFTFNFTAPTTVGTFDIVANAGGVSKTQAIIVQTSTTSIPAAIGPILSASVAANPSVVPTNTINSTVNRTEIRALFVGANNAPIQNVRVRFDLNSDPASIGGTFSTGSSVLYSDANGIATSAYIPADRASPTNGVTIRACYSTNDFPANTCPAQAVATITVIADPLAVTIGTNELISEGVDKLTYIRKFVILVVDASGRAKGNVDIVPSIDLPIYYKGRYVRSGGTWIQGDFDSLGAPRGRAPYGCPNEDQNRNGVNETADDVNHNGSLEPRKSDAAVSLIGGSKTRDDGTAIVQIEYPKNVASWLEVKLLVSATGVSGTEGRAMWTELLPVPTSALGDPSSPAFVFSPYGTTIDNDSSGLTPCQIAN